MTHDPGGKVSVALPEGVIGTAEFSSCGRYRHLLTRDWGVFAGLASSPEPRIVWIGMNPSTATAEVDDPTMIRIRGFTQRLGFSSYAMVNVMDYRATQPASLLCYDTMPVCSPKNIPTILRACKHAAVIVCAWGAINARLRSYSERLEEHLILGGHALSCLGFNKAGSPRHPLYVRNDTPLRRYPR